MHIKIITASAVLVAFFLLVLLGGEVKAQQQSGWDAPYQLSTISGAVMNSSNKLVADRYGYVHAFWVESGVDDGAFLIQHARFDGGQWSPPVDIYMAPPGNWTIRSLSATLDPDDTVHIAWIEGNAGPVYIMHAPIHLADSAQNWSQPNQLDIPAYQIAMAVDSQSVYHLVYSEFYGLQSGIYHVESLNNGFTWSQPWRIEALATPDYVPLTFEVTLDDADNLHVIWQYTTTGQEFLSKDVYYTRLVAGETWSNPFPIDVADESDDELRAAWPRFAIMDQEIHVVWAGNSETRREHRISTDAGETWGNPTQIFGELHGQAGDAMTVDAEGNVHFLGQIRYPQGIWHSYWQQDRWSIPSMVYLIIQNSTESIGDRVHAHSIAAAVRTGNQLVMTFTNSPGEGSLALYAMHHSLEDVVPSLVIPTPVVPTATPVPTATGEPHATLQPTPTLAHVLTDVEVLPRAGRGSAPGDAIWASLISAFLVVGGAFIIQVWRRR